MTEAVVKGELVKKLRKGIPWAVTLRHEDQFTAGIPDISVTGGPVVKDVGSARRVVWLEIKYADFAFKGLQHHTLKRLGGYYIIYDEAREVFIVDPREKAEVITGRGHDIIVEFVKKCLTT
jgi:hypothetical protein